MYKLSAKKVLHELVKRAIKTPVNAIKKKSIDIYSNFENTHKLKMKNIYEDMNSFYSYVYILILSDGNFIIYDNSFQKKELKIINGKTFQIQKKIKINYYKSFQYISDIISLKKNEIIFCDAYFRIGYIQFNDEYNIKNIFYKTNKIEKEYYKVNLKYLKNGKILYIGNSSIFKIKKEETIDLSTIYLLTIDRKNNKFILESKINVCRFIFYEIPSKKKYIINFKKDFVSIFNSKNLKLIKDIKFYIYDNMKILNDDYFVQGGDKGVINLYNLDTFELIISVKSNKYYNINNIYLVDKNIFFTNENISGDEINCDENIIKKWEYKEKEKIIKCLGYFYINNKDYLFEMKKIKNKDNIYFFRYSKGFELKEILNE